MTTILYGIANCDSCRRAREWLEAHGIEYRFHDLRKDRLEPDMLDRWLTEAGWEKLVNRRGTTWRRLPEREKGAVDATSARRLMLAHPTLIKRPLLEVGAALLVGFSSARYDVAFEGAD